MLLYVTHGKRWKNSKPATSLVLEKVEEVKETGVAEKNPVIRLYGDVIGFDDKDFQEMALTISFVHGKNMAKKIIKKHKKMIKKC